MKQFLKNIALTLTMSAMMFGGLAVVAPASGSALFENSKNQACAGVALSTTSTTCDEKSETKVNDLIAKVLNILSFAVGVVAVVMIIIAGIKFATSGGDSNNVTSARNTMLYAIVGLVIVAIAQVIVKFVIHKVT